MRMSRAISHATGVMARRARWLLWVSALAPPAIIVGTSALMTYRGYMEPVNLWFEPISIEVPDFCEDHVPKLTYTRRIKRPFLGQFVAWFEDDGGDFPIGTFHSLSFRYSPRPGETVHPQLPQFMGQATRLDPGEYHISVTWTVKRPGHYDTHISLDSNTFTVLPKDDPKCSKTDSSALSGVSP